LCFIELGVTYLPFTLARAFTTFRLATIYLPKLLLYDNFRWNPPVQICTGRGDISSGNCHAAQMGKIQ
jgi:hypothetical protein